jgi:hypothetical protein
MNIKMALFLTLALGSSFNTWATKDSTVIGRFELDVQDLIGTVKTFVNNTKHDLILRWGLREPGTMRHYTQEPILRRGDRVTVDFAPALSYLSGVPKVEHSLELLRVKQLPKGAGHPLITTKLKDGDFALQIHKAKFLKNKVFAFSRNASGLLMLQASQQ